MLVPVRPIWHHFLNFLGKVSIRERDAENEWWHRRVLPCGPVVLLQSALVEVLLGRRTREPNLEVSLVIDVYSE